MKKSVITIPRNVQFIYEHSLAREELGAGFDLQDVRWDISDPWAINVCLNGQKRELIERSAYAGRVDEQETVYSELIKPLYQGGEYNRTRSVNQYLTHWIYPYKGKFHPQMIRALINIAKADRGSVLFEPFCGSGTAALEALLLGLDVKAIDISPLCVKLTRVKTKAWQECDRISSIVDAVLSGATSLQDTIDADHGAPIIAEFFEIVRMVSLSDEENRGRDYEAAVIKNLTAMRESIQAMNLAVRRFKIRPGNVDCFVDDVRAPRQVKLHAAADLIVTSPPYSIALDYVKNDKHALKALGLDVKKIRNDFIGVAGRGIEDRLERYERDMKAAFVTMGDALKTGGKAIVIIGNVTIDKREVFTTDNFVDWARECDLHLTRELPKIVFGLYNVMADEKILFFRKGS